MLLFFTLQNTAKMRPSTFRDPSRFEDDNQRDEEDSTGGSGASDYEPQLFETSDSEPDRDLRGHRERKKRRKETSRVSLGENSSESDIEEEQLRAVLFSQQAKRSFSKSTRSKRSRTQPDSRDPSISDEDVAQRIQVSRNAVRSKRTRKTKSQPAVGVSAPRDSEAEGFQDVRAARTQDATREEEAELRQLGRRKKRKGKAKIRKAKATKTRSNVEAGPFPSTDGESNDEEIEAFRAAIAVSEKRQFGPAVKKEKSRRLSEIFRTGEEKPDRLTRVMEILNDVCARCIGSEDDDPCPALEKLKLSTRRHRLRHDECGLLATVLMAECKAAMLTAGFRGLDVPLVTDELVHIQLCLRDEAWYPKIPADGEEDGDSIYNHM